MIEKVRGLYAEADQATGIFARASGIVCRSGCGDCCNDPGVEASPVEMLPIANELFKAGRLSQAYDRLEEMPKRCIFYAPHPRDETKGRCGIYENRPLVCRLFGFAGTRNKRGAMSLAACRWHKRETPELMETVISQVERGELEAPVFADFRMRLRGVVPSVEEPLPINEAFKKAAERVGLQPLTVS